MRHFEDIPPFYYFWTEPPVITDGPGNVGCYKQIELINIHEGGARLGQSILGLAEGVQVV